MVFESPKPDMTLADFKVLGINLYQRGGVDPKLPNRRLEIPVPSTTGELHQIAQAVAEFSNELREAASSAGSGRHAVMDFEFRVKNWNARMAERRREWEVDLKKRIEGDPGIINLDRIKNAG